MSDKCNGCKLWRERYADLKDQLAERDEKISLQQHALDINNYKIGELESALQASQQREAELREIIAEARAQTNNIVIQEILEQVEYKALSGGG